MSSAVRFPKALLGDRIQWMAVLIVACFVSVLLLKSQSRASYPTYALAILMIVTFPQWRDVLQVNLMRWIIALLLWLCLSVFWSDPFEWRAAISVWTRALLVFFFVVAFAECQLRGQLQRWMGVALTVVGAGAVLAAIVNFYLTNPEDGRLNGLGQLDTHVVAALIYGVVLIFALRTFITSPSIGWKIAASLVVIAIAYAVGMSDSRNAWVSVSVGSIVYLACEISKDPRSIVQVVVPMGFLLAVAMLVLILGDESREWILPRGDSFRPMIWSSTFDRMRESLLFGLGVLTNDDVLCGDFRFPHPHSMYLAVLFQGGVIGLGLFGVVAAKSARRLVDNLSSRDCVLGFAVLVLALLSYMLDGHELIDKVGETWFLFWLPVSVAIGVAWRPEIKF